MTDATIIFRQRFLGQQIRNVTVWSNVPETPADMQLLADELRARWAGQVQDRHVTGWSLDGITVAYNQTNPIYSVEYTFTQGSLVGTDSTPPTISQACLLVSTQSQGPPPNRGRIYFGGLGESQTQPDGRWFQAARTDFQGMVVDWSNGIDFGNGVSFLLIARRNPDGTLDLTSGVANVIARDIPAIQRSRRLGSGI